MSLKQLISIFITSLLTLYTYCQNNDDDKHSLHPSEKKNELKINVTNILIYPAIDLTYEKLLKENNSLGMSIFVSLVPSEKLESSYISIYDDFKSLAFRGFYRRFFSKGHARGFFLEGFTSLNQGNELTEVFNSDIDTGPEIITREEVTKRTDLAIGIALGVKFIIENRFIIELHAGYGYNLLNNRDYEYTSRGGVSVGYRF